MKILHWRLVAALSTALAVFVLLASCTNSSEDVSDTLTAAPEAPTVSAALEQPSDERVFMRVIAPLDEARGYCLDIPGHASGVRIESPLQAHTCKHGIWNHDGRFDQAALADGSLSMPHYELCVRSESASAGARLFLGECSAAGVTLWTVQASGEIALAASQELCITIEAGPGRNAGGPQYLMKGGGLDACLPQSADRQRWTTVTPR